MSMKSTLLAQELFCRGLNSIKPNQLIKNHVNRSANTLILGHRSYDLKQNVFVVGFGKAVSGMCRALQEMIGDHIVGGALSIPSGSRRDLEEAGKSDLLPLDDGKIKVFEGAKNNLLDHDSVTATKHIINVCKSAVQTDIVISLISGGGSALLTSPTPPLTIEDKVELTKILTSRGASIGETNVVRQNLSDVKGGKLAKIAHPAQIVSLILSDGIGDPLNLLASGPTVKRTTTKRDAVSVINKYGVASIVPSVAMDLLNDTVDENIGDYDCLNLLIGTNETIIKAMHDECSDLGLSAVVFSRELQGEAKKLGERFARLAMLICKHHGNPDFVDENLSETLCSEFVNDHGNTGNDFKNVFQNSKKILCDSDRGNKNGVCIIAGGETTVTLTPDPGKGGRNQEMVLSAALELYRLSKNQKNGSIFEEYELTFLSAGTDGQDGPTDATGAVFSTSKLTAFDEEEAAKSLCTNDSYRFFDGNGGLIKTGLTGTNVMDVQLLMISFKEK